MFKAIRHYWRVFLLIATLVGIYVIISAVSRNIDMSYAGWILL